MAKVMLIDDEVTMVQMVTELLRSEGHEVFPFTNGNAALDAIEATAPELVITDLCLDKTRAQHGLEILSKARSLNPPAIVILITGYGSIETAVEAMRKGAYDYLEKPFKLDQLKLCVQRALSYNDAVSENIYLKKQLKKKYQFSAIIGSSPKMQEVFKMIDRVADTDSTILVLGESGTGKELVARALHFNSRRQFAPFVPVNCSAIPENLLESELFGHRKGSFTGAVADKKGLFQEADGGTIFLDEIGTMPSALQSRLLRVLQEREVRRVGDNVPIYVNVRVVAATNEPLEERVKQGTFREDLYYRLNVIPITIPSLRERLEDIELLTLHFLRDKVHAKSGKPFGVSRQVLNVLCAHHWPGNVRELENAIERACALSETNVIEVLDLPPVLHKYASASTFETEVQTRTDLPPNSLIVLSDALYPHKSADVKNYSLEAAPGAAPVDPARPIVPLKQFLREQEVSYLNRALSIVNGDKEKAAQMLGVSLATLYRKLSEDEAE